MITYNRDIICLPKSNQGKNGDIKIPRGREVRDMLSRNGLIGKIRLSCAMTETEIMDEIRSVFAAAMNDDPDFPFAILQPAGGCSKSLTIPPVSSSYKWTASAVAGKNSKCQSISLQRMSLRYITVLSLINLNLTTVT